MLFDRHTEHLAGRGAVDIFSCCKYLGITWSLELYQQTIARLWRQGQTSGTVTVIHIITAGTVDERILKVLETKDHTQSALIEAVKAEVVMDGS